MEMFAIIFIARASNSLHLLVMTFCFCFKQRKVLGGQALTEKENSRLQSPLSSCSGDGHGKENTSFGGVSIASLQHKANLFL